MITSLAPERLQSIDMLRGVALLGILFMNIQSFSMPFETYINPTVYGDFSGVNQLVWIVSHLFADQKFMSVFSMLFGVGVIIFLQNLSQKRLSNRLHFIRMGWLLVFGLVHAYLLWYGDVLFSYALCGLFIYVVRNKATKTLIMLSVIFFTIPSLITFFFQSSLNFMPQVALEELQQSWTPSAELINNERHAYTAGWLEALPIRAEKALFLQTFLFMTNTFWRVSALMILGIILFRKRFFHLEWSANKYFTLAAVSTILGLALTGYGVHYNLSHQFTLAHSMFFGSQFNYWGSAIQATGYAAWVMLACKVMISENRLQRVDNTFTSELSKKLANVGRMAFTNYIMQTLFCTGIFYYLGLFGEASRLVQFSIAITIITVQLFMSDAWLRRYKMGPLEKLWRFLTYKSARSTLANTRCNHISSGNGKAKG
ncbi:DUF418 domain-containing protein [Aestuariibacter sp. AA17]|uniref:DUF418 domain-containing protein n=1 Tax=Fluctibacter corallii TaxID=2984329 RepID=A0ABT3A943_9ALTE|nr:DUF418 domain-containing protein [Aestuariibacter sp. AA17]MCV2885186.1 DUF418 domain-containing protein [Aestuariibacter sp. AA17]